MKLLEQQKCEDRNCPRYGSHCLISGPDGVHLRLDPPHCKSWSNHILRGTLGVDMDTPPTAIVRSLARSDARGKKTTPLQAAAHPPPPSYAPPAFPAFPGYWPPLPPITPSPMAAVMEAMAVRMMKDCLGSPEKRSKSPGLPDPTRLTRTSTLPPSSPIRSSPPMGDRLQEYFTWLKSSSPASRITKLEAAFDVLTEADFDLDILRGNAATEKSFWDDLDIPFGTGLAIAKGIQRFKRHNPAPPTPVLSESQIETQFDTLDDRVDGRVDADWFDGVLQ